MRKKDPLEEALRARLLAEIGQSHPSSISNNNYNYAGGAQASPSVGGVMEHMGKEDPELYDYMVDISRTDKKDPEGKTVGWDKKVHRYRQEKGGSGPEKKK